MTQLKERVLELNRLGQSERGILKTLQPEYPDLTRYRVKELMRDKLLGLALPDNTPPAYGGGSIEQHAHDWESIDRSLQNHYWFQGAIAASLSRSYGSGGIKEFAALVGKSPERIYQLIRTYSAFKGQDVSGMLTFTHFQYAAESDKPDYWIRRAHDEQLSTRQLETLIKGKPLPEFRIKEPEPVDVPFRPVSEGHAPFPPAEQAVGQAEQAAEPETISYPKRSLKAWYAYIAGFSCLRCGAGVVEVAHLEAALSSRTSGWLPRRNGLAEWTCIPLCAHCHRTGIDSVHAIGEDEFCERLRSVKFVHDWIITRLLEFFTQN